MLAARRNKRIVTQHEFEDAKDKVMMGAERRSLVMSEEERRNTAYHEAGHAIVGLAVPYDPLHKVTIIPRGRALGVTMNLPEGDRHTRTREWCESRLAVLFGGREAELDPRRREERHQRCHGRHPDGDATGTRDGHGMGHVRQARARALQWQ